LVGRSEIGKVISFQQVDASAAHVLMGYRPVTRLLKPVFE